MGAINLNTVKTLAKAGAKYIGPVAAGIMAVVSDIENQQLKDTVKELTKKVAEMESKMK